jgi:hypothetical protein
MGTARYAFRVRGPASDAAMTARQEGLEAQIDPISTAVHGWLPDQSAVSGMLARIRLLGLELIEIRRLPPVTVTAGPPRDRRPPPADAGTRRPPDRAIPA